MSAESPRHGRSGGPLTVASQPPSDRTLIDTVSGFISDVTLTTAPAADPRDTIQWAHFETADINEPVPEGDHETELSPLLLVLGYGSGVQIWLIPPNGEAQEVMSWRQGSVRVLRILPTPSGGDSFAVKRPLLALCDSAGPGPLYCSLSFISIRGGDQVKSIKFKNPILDVLANKRSVVVSFSERFAVFDACTLEDRMAVTTCYPCPCPLGGGSAVNPLALGDRWLAYADKKLNSAKRSSGGCEGEGVSSYTATVLHAAKSLSKGLRGLGESVASSLAGGRTLSQSPSPPNADHQQPGVVTILDIEASTDEDGQDGEEVCDSVVAHFVAHSDAIISLKFDASGMLLVTADKRGHDFHVFRVHPHPCGPSLASVHHLYILHRGDTTAKVQDISISLDSRWAAVSTLRGTTHVFPISPYGGPCGVRTHTQPRVVNRLSRFHRSAGLPIHASNARSSSPVGDGMAQGAWFPNPRLPPYPLPTTGAPLAQLRPMPAATGIPTHTITRNSSGRQRLSSLSEDTGGVPLLACARWGAAPPAPPAGLPTPRSPAAHALYVMAATGHLLHYLIHPRHAAGVSKEKVCDDTPVELGVELVAQWPLNRPPAASDMAAPLAPNNPLLHRPHFKSCSDAGVSEEERWLAHVEIVTHAGPHRRLWMGPQFVFKTYNATLSGSSSSLLEAEAVEVEAGAGSGVARSPPVNMPGARPLVPVLIDSGSASSLEHSPSDSFRRKSYIMEASGKPVGDKVLGDVQLREDLAEAMRETEQGSRCGDAGPGLRVAAVARAVDPLGTVVAPGEDDDSVEDDDPDQYTQANADEALFRPVVRAPAAFPPHPELSASPLPAGTRIPVQNLMRADPLTPDDDSVPLKSEVVIPAALTGAQRASASAQDTHAPVQYSLEQDVASVQQCSENRDIHKSAIHRSGKNDERSPQRSSAKKDKHVSSQRYSAKKDEPSSPQCSSAKKDEHAAQRGSVKKDEPVPCERSSAKKDEQLSREHSSTRKHEQVSPQRGLVKKNELVPPERSSPWKDEPIARGHGLGKKDENISSQRCSVKKDECISSQRGSAMIDEHISSRLSSVVEDGNLAIQRLSVERDAFSIQRSSVEKDEHFLSCSSAKKVDHVSPLRRSVERDENISPQRRSVKKEEYISQSCSTKNEEIVTVQPRSLKKDEHVFVPRHSVERIVPREPVVEIQIRVETIPAGAEVVDETISADKPVKVSKSSNKGKSRDKRSATTREEPLLSDDRKEEGDAKNVSLPKLKETLPSDIQMCSPKPSVRQPTKKCSKNFSEAKQAVEIKDDPEEQDAVEFTIRLPASNDEPREMEGSAKDEVCIEDECEQVDKPIKVDVAESEPINKTEDQIWAMLSNSPRELVESNVSESRKFSEEIKPKPRKNKKNRKLERESEEIILDLPAVDPFVSVTKEDALYQQEEPIVTSSYKKEFTMKPTARDKKIEPLMKEFIKAKSLSPESSINIKQIKDQTTCSTHSDILRYETNITPIDKDYKSTSSSKIKTNEPTRSKKTDEAVKGVLKGFDLPIDFDAYLVSKSKDKKSDADSKSSSSKKEDPLQELFSDSLFSLQPSKAKKPNRKDRVKIDDYVSIEKLQSKERVAISECKKYSPTIIDLDNESIGSKQKAEDSEIVIVDSAMEDFPTIASSHNIRSHKKRWTQPVSVDHYVPPPVKSYSSIAAVSKPQKDMRLEEVLGVDLADNILEPPKPCRVTLQEKLAELCKRSDIAVAECDSPDDLTFVDEPPCEFELPPLEPLDFSLDEFKLEVMRDSLLEEKLVSPICNIDIDDILFNIKDSAGKKRSERESTAGESVSKYELKPATKTEGEQMEKSSDDDNTPVSSQTDSDDKEDKRNTATDPTLPALKSGNGKKKARQKKRK